MAIHNSHLRNLFLPVDSVALTTVWKKGIYFLLHGAWCVQTFEWMNALLIAKGSRRIFLWDRSASPLIARLSCASLSELSSLSSLAHFSGGSPDGFRCARVSERKVSESSCFLILLRFNGLYDKDYSLLCVVLSLVTWRSANFCIQSGRGTELAW